jgi:hypothetical protein
MNKFALLRYTDGNVTVLLNTSCRKCVYKVYHSYKRRGLQRDYKIVNYNDSEVGALDEQVILYSQEMAERQD